MAVALELLVKQLSDSGIIAAGKLENFVPPKANPKDAEELLRELHKQNLLTAFQAQQVAANRIKSLILGEYLIVDRIGAGGMGQVFKAEHRKMKRKVAVKMLPAATMKDAAAIARFEREVESSARLSHPNIVAAHDAGQVGAVHFLVMEYVEGQDLSAPVKKNGPFPVAKAVNYILQAARGLEYAHSEGVIHRDIKPANLLLDKKGVVKILDMGLARIESDGNAATQAELTQSGTIMGSVDYMAPEQGMSTKSADSRADIYSLGCSLYYLIAGKATYDGETMAAKLVAHHTHPIPDLRSAQTDVTDELDAVFKKMVAKRIEDRYQTMAEVIADLERCIGGSQSSIQQSPSTNFENSALTFLKDMPIQQTLAKSKATKKVAAQPSSSKTPPWKNVKLLVGTAFLGVMILAGIIISLRTKDGTLIVEVDQPDAMVQVLDSEGKVEVSQKGGVGKITISVDPGKHRLRVEKNGFVVFGQEFEIESGSEKAITAKLVPVKVVPAVAATTNPTLAFNDLTFQQWMKQVAALPAEKQVEAVINKLQELNTGFDGKKTEKIENGAVTEFSFFTDNVTDISPVRAFRGLRDLKCAGSGRGKGKLSDLSPLQGMKLIALNCGYTRVSDLSPLKGMPLTSLPCNDTQVSDLSPLSGMSLKLLWCSNTNVSSLSPLKGMPLNELTFSNSQVSDLSPLQGMPLTALHCLNIHRVTDLSPLEDCKNLQLLLLGRIRITPAAVAALQAKLPNCKIEWDDPAKPTPAAPIGPAPPLAIAHFDAAQAKAHQQVWADHLGTEVETINSVGMKMVLIPPGEFMMGSTDEQVAEALKAAEEVKADLGTEVPFQNAERPQHKVVITKPSLLSATEVTVGQFKQFVAATKYVTEAEKKAEAATKAVPPTAEADQPPPKPISTYLNPGWAVADDFPAAAITWNDAVAYCQWLSAQEKRTYRLPTDAEWEYACRAGTTTQYSFGDDYKELPKYGWHVKNAGNKSHPVGTLLPNPFGLFDMHGNLYEWCGDWYDEKWYSASTPNDPIGPSKGGRRVIRGGGWHNYAPYCRSAFRNNYMPTSTNSTNGFRYVLELDVPIAAATTPAASSKLFMHDPAFPQWMAQVQAMPAEQQIEAVSKKLMELNPGFDGKVTEEFGDGPPKIEKGVVTELRFSAEFITDLSPVRALPGLKRLLCDGERLRPIKGPLADLTPLRGMKLLLLTFNHTQVADLSPLNGMPLSYLHFGGTQVINLSPLRGMPLTQISFGETQVSDLSPLAGMNLNKLAFTGTKVSDLTPLRGMPLKYTLEIGHTPVSDLSPLHDCETLTRLKATYTKVTPADISALQKALPNCVIEWDDPAKATTPQPRHFRHEVDREAAQDRL